MDSTGPVPERPLLAKILVGACPLQRKQSGVTPLWLKMPVRNYSVGAAEREPAPPLMALSVSLAIFVQTLFDWSNGYAVSFTVTNVNLFFC